MDGNGSSHEDRADRGRVIEVSVPLAPFSGLMGVINALLLFAAWMVVGIGYLCVPGSVAGAVLALVLAVTNMGNGLAAAALCLGIGIACAGLCAPIFVGTRAAQGVLLRATRSTFGVIAGEGR